MQQITSLLHIYTNMKDSTIEQAYDLFISRFEDSLNDVFKNNRNTILFENANPEQELMDNVIQCIIYKIHTEYTLKKYEQEYRSLVERYQMGVIPYYALASGFLSGKYQSEHDFASSARGEGIQKRYWNSRGKQTVTALTQTAEELNCSAASLALAWLMAQPDITAPIASATKPAHLEDFLSACNLKLENTTLKKLNQASVY